jgi:hypothetical protein
MIEVYEANGETTELRGNTEPALVFIHVGQEPADGIAPEMLHPRR